MKFKTSASLLDSPTFGSDELCNESSVLKNWPTQAFSNMEQDSFERELPHLQD